MVLYTISPKRRADYRRSRIRKRIPTSIRPSNFTRLLVEKAFVSSSSTAATRAFSLFFCPS